MTYSNQNQNLAPVANPKIGVSITGIFKGVRMTEQGTYRNFYCAISCGDNVDDYGVCTERLEEINLFEQEYQALIKDHSLVGQPVRAWVNYRVRSGTSERTKKPYAFLQTNLVRNTYIESLAKVEEIKKAG